MSRWWQLKYYLFSPRTLQKWNPIWWAYFSKMVGSTTNKMYFPYWTLFVFFKRWVKMVATSRLGPGSIPRGVGLQGRVEVGRFWLGSHCGTWRKGKQTTSHRWETSGFVAAWCFFFGWGELFHPWKVGKTKKGWTFWRWLKGWLNPRWLNWKVGTG